MRRRSVQRQVGTARDGMLKASKRVIHAYQQANEIELEKLKNECIDEAPIDTGELRRSIKTETRRTREGVAGKVVATAPHALVVHETPRDYRVGKWKYLEDPWKRALKDWEANVAEHVVAELERG